MQTLRVQAENTYDVIVGCNWKSEFSELIADRNRVVVLVPATLAAAVVGSIVAAKNVKILEIPDGEIAKSIQTLEMIWQFLGENGFTRSDLMVAIGGGTTTDIGGFAAATWLRGIDWVAIPTTLAGMVDAAIGGKTGINSAFGKNLIGSFHSPRKVIIDQIWLETISDRDFSAGMAEVIKCGFIADPKILEIVEASSLAELRNSLESTQELILRAIAIKGKVVGEDFRDNFAREVLNYGHTMGHAIELHSQYRLRHGEAIAIGMIFAAELARFKGVLSAQIVERHHKILTQMKLPTTYSSLALPELLPLLLLDKKSRGTTLRFVALSDLAAPMRLEGVTEGEIKATYERVTT